MACYHPTPAYQEWPGKRPKLWPPVGQENLHIPCGTCLGCKTERSQQWAVRAMQEASQHDHNAFLTLTYDDSRLPPGGELEPRDLTLFIKRLRKACANRGPTRHPALVGHSVRYLACGEYGDLKGRPHYHMLAFGLGATDLVDMGKDLYHSDAIQALWDKGIVRIGAVTHASAAYVAQYTLKKLGATHCDRDGVVMRAPFLRMSLRPGIGVCWLNRYASDLRYGYVVSQGEKHKIPRYYRKKLLSDEPDLSAEVETHLLEKREKLNPANNTADVRHAAEKIHQRKQQLTRKRSL